MTSPALAKYLMELAEDPKKMDDLKRNPDDAMTAAGLSTDDMEIIRSGEPSKIRAAIDGSPEIKGLNVTVVVVVVVVA